jgi:carbamoyl-phosphate synthase large subunit
MDKGAPALREADCALTVPPINDAGYIEHLLALCRQHQIRLLLSVNDLELPLLAEHRSRFHDVGTIVVIGSPEAVHICFDKWATFQFLQKHNLPAPATFTSLDEARQALRSNEISFPLVIKPRWGTASLCVEYAEDQEELEWAYQLVHKKLMRTILAEISATDLQRSVLIQEGLVGYEYVLDIVNDLQGHHVATFVKKKLSHSMEPGGAYRTVTVESPPLEELGRAIGEKLGHLGVVDCDAFISQGRCYALEMNPRFGGGYPFTHVAGVNVPAALIAWARGEQPDPRWLEIEQGVESIKCEQLVVVSRETAD